jgi:serine/threonine protein kinase
MRPLGASDPRSIGPYTVLGVLGQGGMGKVYLGQSRAGKRVALKVIRSHVADNPVFRERFAREVEAARAISALYTAPIVDADPQADTPWFATTYIEGPSLEDEVAKNGPMSVPSVLILAAGLAEAFIAIHKAGLVHRDLKPANVLLTMEGPCVIDFGIALIPDAASLTQGQFVGTPAYQSPEGWGGEQMGPPSDIYSIGATLAFAATGRGPLGQATPRSMFARMAAGKLDTSAVPEQLKPIIARCLARDPKYRPTASDLLTMLTEAGATHPYKGWYSPSAVATTVPSPGPAPATHTPPVSPPPISPPAFPAAASGLAGPPLAGSAPVPPASAAPASPAPAPPPGPVPAAPPGRAAAAPPDSAPAGPPPAWVAGTQRPSYPAGYGGQPRVPQPRAPQSPYAQPPGVAKIGGFPAAGANPGQIYPIPRQRPGGSSRQWLWITLPLVLVLLAAGGTVTAILLSQDSVPPPSAGATTTMPPTAAGALTLVVPAQLAGLTKNTQTDLQTAADNVVKQLENDIDGETGAVAAFYNDPHNAGSRVLFIGVTADIVSPMIEIDDSFSSFNSSGDIKVSNIVEVPAGPLGGKAKCGDGMTGDVKIVVCVWADNESLGFIVFYNRSIEDSKQLMLRIRGEASKRA